jgi:hypothetical protein
LGVVAIFVVDDKLFTNPIDQALKEAFLKTDADLRTEAGHAECLKIRREVKCARDSTAEPAWHRQLLTAAVSTSFNGETTMTMTW